MSETALWDYVNLQMRNKWHASRVESHASSPGIPDVDYCIEGYESHIELKFSNSTSTPKIRPSQIRWHVKRAQAGGTSYILTHFAKPNTEVYMLHLGQYASELARNPKFDFWWKRAFYRWNETIDFEDFELVIGGKI